MRLAGADRLQQLLDRHACRILLELRLRGQQGTQLAKRDALDDRQSLANDVARLQLREQPGKRDSTVDRIAARAQ